MNEMTNEEKFGFRRKSGQNNAIGVVGIVSETNLEKVYAI